MKKTTTLLLLATLCLTVMAQGKLTLPAQLHLMQERAKAARRAAPRTGGTEASSQAPRRTTLVLTTDQEDLASTVEQMKKKGAEVCSRLGRQIVVSVPADSVESMQHIKGVKRIDKGHRGHWKSDVTRQATGVAQLNGPTVAEGATPYTGKGVTICMIDAGFDFQHPAFKDSEGRSRIKCVYLMGDNKGNKFTISDPDLGEYTFPGSVYDTPELIATLTTDAPTEYHGTHTAGIAAGSLSPQGFGGMAPEADLVLIPLDEVEVEGYDEADDEEYMELALGFAAAYALQSEQPVVLSCSANSHGGPHDGTSSVTEAIKEISECLVPVFSAGNEGGYPIHLYQKFTAAKKSVKTILMAVTEDESGEHQYATIPSVAGYVRTGDEVSVQLSLVSVNQFTGRTTTLWSSEKCTAKHNGEPQTYLIDSSHDAGLSKYFDGVVGIGAMEDENGRLNVAAMADGGTDRLYLWVLTVSGSEGTEIDLWDELVGFGGVEYVGLPGYVDGDNDISGGDWTSTDRVVSVGAYCANIHQREYDGTVTDTSEADDDEEADKLNEIAWFSSYGTSFNGVSQPMVCAPGVNVVSSVNHYAFEGATYVDAMQWDGYPYTAESGTSMSCPAVSGAIALWMQAKPDMTFDDVIDVLAHSSVKETKDSARWGFGRISATQGIDYINSLSGIKTVNTSDSGRHAGAYYDLQGRRFHAMPSTPGLYIHQGRKVVVR